MRNIGISNHIIIIFFLAILILSFAISKVHIILNVEANNSKIKIIINIRYLFNLINIKKQLYPLKGKQRKRKEKKANTIKNNKIKIKLALSNFLTIYRTIEKIEIYEIYSKVSYGSKVFNFTSFIFILINCIYADIYNIVNTKKIYLGVKPDYTKNYLKANIKIHATPSIKDIANVVIAVIKISNKNKEALKHESNKFDSKSYGDNS